MRWSREGGEGAGQDESACRLAWERAEEMRRDEGTREDRKKRGHQTENERRDTDV